MRVSKCLPKQAGKVCLPKQLKAKGDSDLRPLLRTLYLIPVLILIACDPGMTIRQTEPPAIPTTLVGPNDKVIVHIKTTRQLIGETWYDPEVKVTNTLNSPITVTSVELKTGRDAYANNPSRLGAYPLSIMPGSTEPLDVSFRLKDNVRKTFQQSAE